MPFLMQMEEKKTAMSQSRRPGKADLPLPLALLPGNKQLNISCK